MSWTAPAISSIFKFSVRAFCALLANDNSFSFFLNRLDFLFCLLNYTDF